MKRIGVKIFFINLLIALICFLPTIIVNNGVLFINHDYNAQYISFNALINNALKTGNGFFWNNSIDIGGNLLELFTSIFYTPFSIETLSVLFPVKLLPYVLSFVTILNFTMCGVTSHLYFRRHIKNENVVIICSILYAFSGYQIINLVYANFYKYFVFFPLLLLSFEMLVEDNRKFLFMTCIAIASTNIFFFTMEVVFLIIYFFVKYGYEYINKKEIKKMFIIILRIMIEVIVGIMIMAFINLPNIEFLLGNERATGNINLIPTIDNLKEFYIKNIKSYLLIPQAMSMGVFPRHKDFMSNSIYIPIFSFILYFTYAKNKKDYLKRLIIVFFIFNVLRLLNASFYLFKGEYHRWNHMFLMVLILVTGKILEDKNKYDTKKITYISIGLIGLLSITLFIKNVYIDKNIDYKYIFSLLFLMIFTIILYVFAYIIYEKKEVVISDIKRIFLLFIVPIFIMVNFNIYYYQNTIDTSGVSFDINGKSKGENLIKYYETAFLLDNEIGPYRYKFVDNNNEAFYFNLGMLNNLPTINSFVSSIGNDADRFYTSIDNKRGVHTSYGVNNKEYLLGVRYLVKLNTLEDKKDERYTFIKNINDYFDLYEVNAYLDMGYTYDKYILKSEYEKLSSTDKVDCMLQALVIKDEEENEINKYFNNDKTVLDKTSFNKNKTNEAINKHKIDKLENYKYKSNEYSFNVKANKDSVLYMSIPNSKYFKAFVNGNNEKIIDVNGMMAFKISEGENSVKIIYDYGVFKYYLMISFIGVLLCGVLINNKKWYFNF